MKPRGKRADLTASPSELRKGLRESIKERSLLQEVIEKQRLLIESQKRGIALREKLIVELRRQVRLIGKLKANPELALERIDSNGRVHH